MYRYRSLLAIAGLAFLLPIAAICGFNLYVDPFHYYRLDGAVPTLFSINQRWQNPGILRRMDYDTVILGTSLSGNIRPGSFDRRYGWRTVKAAAYGGSSYTQDLTLRLALRQGKARRVVWELWRPMFDSGTGPRRVEPELPLFLYEPSLETPFRYLLSLDVLRQSWARLRGTDGALPADLVNNQWVAHRQRFEREAIEGFIAGHPVRDCSPLDPGLVTAVAADPTLDRVIAERIEAPIRDHPEVEFVGWLPPARALYRQADSSAAEWARHFHFRRRLYALAATYPNFRLHDFDSVVGWTTDPWRYMDGSHFDLAMAEAIVAALGDGSREVQPGHDADVGSRAIVAAFNAVDWQGQFACDPGHPKKDMRRTRPPAPVVAAAG